MIQIIPAIDLINGKCVRLVQGDYTRKKQYSDSPLIVAKKFEAAGIQRLHLVDLDGAKAGEVINLSVLEEIASRTNLQIDFSGGIRSDKTLSNVFNAGASFVSLGSIAVKDEAKFCGWLKEYGADKILLSADVKHLKISIAGWLDCTPIPLFEFLEKYQEKGIETVICTDISKDGLLTGPAFELYEKIIKKFPKLKLVASGGVHSLEDIECLNDAKIFGVIIGKAIYEDKITLSSLEKYL